MIFSALEMFDCQFFVGVIINPSALQRTLTVGGDCSTYENAAIVKM